MRDKFDVIVVGGGMAGLSCAAFLCKYGIETLLCEKEATTGGLVNTFWHNGYAFDAGIRAFENSGILFPMLKSLGIDLEFKRSPVSIGIDKDWVKLNGRDSLEDFAKMLIMHFPGNEKDVRLITQEIRKVMGYMDVLYGIENPLFLENFNDLQYIIKTLLPWLLRYQININKVENLKEPVQSYLRHFTNNQALIDMIAQHFFENTPAFFALSYFGLYLDYCYPIGGTGQLPKKVTDYIKNAGGEIRTGSKVINVDANKHEIKLVSGETSRYKKLVWAADQKTLYNIQTGEETSQTENQRQKTNTALSGDSVLTVYMGIKLESGYFESRCGAHAFYTPQIAGLSTLPKIEIPTELGEEAIFNWVSDYLEQTTYEISCPSLRDSSLAPEGKTGVVISALMDYDLVKRISDLGNYDAFKQFCTEKIMKVFAATIFPEIVGNIEYISCSSPLTIEFKTGSTGGAITGWAFTNKIIPAESRFKKIAKSIYTPITDVLQCGQWSFSPSGLPVSILTGKLAADDIRKSFKR